MLIWLALIFPILTTVLLLVFYKEQTVWWEVLLLFFSTFLFIFIAKSSVEMLQTSATEYWTGFITEARYYEKWDEKVSCRHPTYCTRCTGSGKRRSCSSYICGHVHPYDVDTHYPYWEAYDNTGATISIEQSWFEAQARVWGERKFVDLNRHYYRIDGNMYVTHWDNKDENMAVVSHSHTYENRVVANNNTFTFNEISKEDKEIYGLFDYPPIIGYTQKHILGLTEEDVIAERNLSILNAKLGKPKQVKVFILVYKDKSMGSSTMQEAYWKGGNKNELVLTIGVNSDNNVSWARTFSWTDKKISVFEATSLVEKQIGKKLVLTEVISNLYPIIQTSFERKSFRDFDYITVEPSLIAIIIVFILTALLNFGVACYIVKNKFVEK